MDNKIISKVFLWMFIGLLVTFLTGYVISINENMLISVFSTGTYIFFLIASLIFGIFSLIGYKTNIDLTKIGTYLIMALFGIIICSLINLFIKNNTFDLILSSITIIIFMGITAYDMQKIKNNYTMIPEENMAIYGALQLYLDYINIFLHLLSIFGDDK